jgi:predicted ATPase
VVIISGPVGVGKTRLIQELACHLNDATVLAGDALKQEEVPPYYPFVTALASYLDNTPPEIATANVGKIWHYVTRNIPEITAWPHGSMIPSQPDYEAVAEETDHQTGDDNKLTLPELVRKTTSKHPWLLIIDHLQWIDIATLNLFEYLATHSADMSIMLIGIIDNTGPVNETLQAQLARIKESSTFTELLLEPITKTDTRNLLENIWGQSVPNDLITAIFNRTHGNPFFIESIASGLAESGVVNWRDEKWHFGPVMEAGLPPSIQEALEWRVQNLSRETKTLLTQAAVLGSEFYFDDLYELSDLSEWDALDSISIALERQLLRTSPGEQLLRFSHPLIQQVLYCNLSHLKQRLLHREAGEALEREHLPEPKRITEWLAHHFLRAGEYEKALIYSIQAAKQAYTIYAYQAAMVWHARALDTAEQLGLNRVNHQQRFSLLLTAQTLAHNQGLRQAELDNLSKLHELAQNLTDPTRQAQAHIQQSKYEFATGKLADATTETQAALIAARQANSGSLACESLIQLANIALYHGQIETAREHLYAAKTDVGTKSDAIEAQRLNGLGTLYRWLDQHVESAQYYRQAVKTSRKGGDRYGQAIYLSNLGALLLQMREYHQAQLAQEQALIIARLTGYIQCQAIAYNRLSDCHTALGSYNIARQFNEQAQKLHRGIESEIGQAMDMQVLGRIHLASRDYVSARDYMGQALEIFQHTRDRLHEGITWLELAMALEGLGHIAKARHAYRQVHNVATELRNQTATIDANAGLARCQLLEGNPDSAAETIHLALEKAPKNNTNLVFKIPYPFLPDSLPGSSGCKSK